MPARYDFYTAVLNGFLGDMKCVCLQTGAQDYPDMGTRGHSSKTAQDDTPTGHPRTATLKGVKHEGLTESPVYTDE